MELLVIKDTNKFKQGDVIKSNRIIREGAYSKNEFISKKHYIVLNEALNQQDLDIIDSIIKKKFSILFWRLYTRAQFLLK